MDSYNFFRVVNILTALSPEERRLLADQIQEQLNQFTPINGHEGVNDVKDKISYHLLAFASLPDHKVVVLVAGI